MELNRYTFKCLTIQVIALIARCVSPSPLPFVIASALHQPVETRLE